MTQTAAPTTTRSPLADRVLACAYLAGASNATALQEQTLLDTIAEALAAGGVRAAHLAHRIAGLEIAIHQTDARTVTGGRRTSLVRAAETAHAELAALLA